MPLPLLLQEITMKNVHQVNHTGSNEITTFSFLSPLISQDFINEIQRIGIKGIESNINQIPSPSNGHLAVVTSSVITHQGQFSGIGAATPEILDGSTSPQTLLDKAYQESLRRSVSVASIAPSADNRTIDVTPVSQGSQQNGNSQKNYKHSPNKPITPKQQKALEGMAMQNGTTLSAVAHETIGKPVNQLSSKDAHELFQKFNDQSVF